MTGVFSDLVGQESVRERFAATLREWRDGRGRLHHAYLFTGPEGLGKRTFAEELGALIVAGGDEDEAYERARRGVHPDLNIVEREGNQIRMEQVLPLVAELSRKPFTATERVWIIPEADRLNAEAGNKLLKSLEEPPDHVVFLLVSSDEERLLPTIVSRCEVVPFDPVPHEAVCAFLRQRTGVAEEAAAAIAALSGGSPGRAVELAGDLAGPGRRETLLEATLRAVAGTPAAETVDRLLRDYEEEVTRAVDEKAAVEIAAAEASLQDDRDRAWRIDQIEKRAKRDKDRLTRRAAQWCLDVVIAVLRDLWVARVAEDAVLLNSDHGAEIVAVAAECRSGPLLTALTTATGTRRDLSWNIDRELAVLALFARIEEVCAGCRER